MAEGRRLARSVAKSVKYQTLAERLKPRRMLTTRPTRLSIQASPSRTKLQLHSDQIARHHTDPAAALINLSNSISSLGSFSPALSPASYPLFHANSMALTLQIHSRDFATASRTALSAWHGATQLYSYGHPVRCILSSTIAQLAAIPPADPNPEADLEYWSNLKDRTAGLRMMVEALKECEIGFGTSTGGGGGGGQVGAKLRRLITDQEEGIAMARKVARELQ